MAERNKLLAYAWSITGDFSTAEDVVQEVALLAIDQGGDVADEGRLKIWLRRAARLKALEALREKRRTSPPLSEEVLEKLESHWMPYDQKSELSETLLAEFLRSCVRELTHSQRNLLRLRYVNGLRSGEIARQLQMKVETVYRTLTRIHSKLADCIEHKLATRKENQDDGP